MGKAPDPTESSCEDVGTLWVLRREECTARCALLALADTCALCVFVNGEPLLSERCEGQHQVFELAERWRTRMTEHGWTSADGTEAPQPDRRRSPRGSEPSAT